MRLGKGEFCDLYASALKACSEAKLCLVSSNPSKNQLSIIPEQASGDR